LGKDGAPGVDHQAVAVVLPATRVQAPLAAGGDVATVLDGAGPDHRLPVSDAGRHREGGRDQKHLGAPVGQGVEQFGKAQVVADGETERDAVALTDDHLVTGREGV